MKCPNCGEEIAKDSVYCNSCGMRVAKKKSWLWLLWASLLLLLIAIALIFFWNNNRPKDVGDRKEMNIKGDVIRLLEKSYYTGDGMDGVTMEGGLFDGATFLSVVFSDEHMARVFYKKWFISLVSDCEIQFDEYGNIILIKSIWDGGGEVHFNYDSSHRLVEMDGRDPAGNQDEGVIRYNYELEGDLVLIEKVVQESDYGDEFKVKYQYDAFHNLSRAIMERRRYSVIFSYDEGRLVDLYFKDFWREGVPLSIQVEYNDNGDIRQVTSTGKRYGETARVTTFEYKYDSHNNWIERLGSVVSGGDKCEIKTIRTYDYR